MNPDATDGRAHGHSRWVKARGVASLIAVAWVLLGPRMAHAADVEAIHFRYAAPPECPAEGELVSVAVDLGGGFRLASPDEPGRTFGVVIEKTERGFSGSLSVRSIRGDERVRTVMCGRCESAVRALGLIMAMALEDAQPAPSATPAPLPGAPARPTEDRQTAERDDPGGIAAMALWGSLGWTPTGAGLMAVAPGATRLGGVVAVTTENVEDPRYQVSPSYVLALGHGQSARLGAVAAWGAPWSRDDWFGFVAEGGVRGGVVHGAVWPLSTGGSNGQNYCTVTPYPYSYDCTSGPGTPKTWRFLSPYVAGTVVVQLLPRLPVRPFLALTGLWSTDYRGSSAGSFSVDAGIAWRSW